MAWGLPPKYQLIKEFGIEDVDLIRSTIASILVENSFSIEQEANYNVQAKKKLSHTLLSIFSFGRPYISIAVMISKKGRVTFNSHYDYNSYVGSTFFDSGKQQKIVQVLVDSLTEKLA